MLLFILFFSQLPLLFFTICDIFQIYDSYKIKYNYKRNIITKQDILNTYKVFFINFFGIIIPMSALYIYIIELLDYKHFDTENINISKFIYQLFYLLLTADFLFYGLHRLMHTPYLYEKYHKFHHTFKEPFAVTNLYVDMQELVLFFLPVIIPTLFIYIHIYVFYVSIILLNFNGIIIHSGYDFTLFKFETNKNKYEFPCIRMHDIHHKFFKFNYGAVTPIPDLICNTYKSF